MLRLQFLLPLLCDHDHVLLVFALLGPEALLLSLGDDTDNIVGVHSVEEVLCTGHRVCIALSMNTYIY